MKRNGDVMRSDRLKQVMQEIDSSFDEKNLGISKFSRFCQEAAQRGLLSVTKLENGQLEVDLPVGHAIGAAAAVDSLEPSRRAPRARKVPSPSEDVDRVADVVDAADADAIASASRARPRAGRSCGATARREVEAPAPATSVQPSSGRHSSSSRATFAYASAETRHRVRR